MKRYLLFTFSHYEPCGGWLDFKGSFDTLAEARDARKTSKDDEWQIVDGQTGEEVEADWDQSRFK